MILFRFILAGIVLNSSLIGCAENKEPKNSFQVVCESFQELEKMASVDSMTPEDRNNFIVSRIEKNIPDSAAHVSWEAVSYAVSEQRYEIFKMGAESELKEAWDCPSMRNLAPLTGAFE